MDLLLLASFIPPPPFFSLKRMNTEVYVKLHLSNREMKIAITEMYLIRIRVDNTVPKRDISIYRRLCYNDSPTYGCWVVRNNTITHIHTRFWNRR